MLALLSHSHAFHQLSHCRGSRQGSEKGASPYMYANHNEMIKWCGIIKIQNCSYHKFLDQFIPIIYSTSPDTLLLKLPAFAMLTL